MTQILVTEEEKRAQNIVSYESFHALLDLPDRLRPSHRMLLDY